MFKAFYRINIQKNMMPPNWVNVYLDKTSLFMSTFSPGIMTQQPLQTILKPNRIK